MGNCRGWILTLDEIGVERGYEKEGEGERLA